jgi:hypothetical protein
MLNRIVDHPITSIGGLVVLAIGGALLGFGKITWEQFLIFIALSGVGAFMKDPKSGGGV